MHQTPLGGWWDRATSATKIRISHFHVREDIVTTTHTLSEALMTGKLEHCLWACGQAPNCVEEDIGSEKIETLEVRNREKNIDSSILLEPLEQRCNNGVDPSNPHLLSFLQLLITRDNLGSARCLI